MNESARNTPFIIHARQLAHSWPGYAVRLTATAGGKEFDIRIAVEQVTRFIPPTQALRIQIDHDLNLIDIDPGVPDLREALGLPSKSPGPARTIAARRQEYVEKTCAPYSEANRPIMRGIIDDAFCAGACTTIIDISQKFQQQPAEDVIKILNNIVIEAREIIKKKV